MHQVESMWSFCEENGHSVAALKIKNGDLTGGGCQLSNASIQIRKLGYIYFTYNDYMDIYCYFDEKFN